jgi:two-component system, NarL family, nitrate/nitrite response regulator NarL
VSEAGLRVLLVGDDPLARGGLAALLAGEAGVTLAGEASSGDELAAAVGSLAPDAALWDLGVAPAAARGLERAHELGALPFVVLLAQEDLAGDALAAGARGILLRDTEPSRLAAALRAAASGLLVLDADLADWILRRRSDAPEGSVEELTARESEVLALLAQGLTNKVIAQRLGVSDHTAKFHVNSILAKLGVGSRTEAVVLAARRGLVAL